jgi:hypothetical protein
VEDLLSNSTPDTIEIVLEYIELAALSSPSDDQADRLSQILAIASENSILSFWIVEADHFLGHQLGLLNEDHRESYKDQQALLREYFGQELCTAGGAKGSMKNLSNSSR